MNLSKDENIIINDCKYVIDEVLEGNENFEVYKIRNKTDVYELRLFKETPSSEKIGEFKELVSCLPPSELFIWPKELVTFGDKIGYINEIMPSSYIPLKTFIEKGLRINSYFDVIHFLIDLCGSFIKLHYKGYVFKNIYYNTFNINPSNGKLLINVNDSIISFKENNFIAKECYPFMAPEVNLGVSNSDVYSDRFSLAVIIFSVLCYSHPFEGQLLSNYFIRDDKFFNEIYGSNPVFIFSDSNYSNKPIRGIHSNALELYPYLSNNIKNAFQKVFGIGISDKENGRISEIDWIKLLIEYSNALLPCISCGHLYVYDFEREFKDSCCAYCHQPSIEFAYLEVNGNKIILYPDKKIYSYNINPESLDFSSIFGIVIRNKANPKIWGIKIDYIEDVLISSQKGNQKVVSKNGVFPIINSLKIKFNDNLSGNIFFVSK